jgi:hypothetical protein
VARHLLADPHTDDVAEACRALFGGGEGGLGRFDHQGPLHRVAGLGQCLDVPFSRPEVAQRRVQRGHPAGRLTGYVEDVELLVPGAAQVDLVELVVAAAAALSGVSFRCHVHSPFVVA